MRDLRMSLEHFISGKGLMDVRKGLGLSREQAAAMLHHSVRTIERQERGHGPIVETLDRMAHHSGLKVSLHVEDNRPRPFIVALSNPCASTGCSTLCICLAGFLARRGKRVRVLSGPDQIATHRTLGVRSEELPIIDSTAVTDSKELLVALQNAGSYDVLLVDCPRINYGSRIQEHSNIPFLQAVREWADLWVVPLKPYYPFLKNDHEHPCFYKEFANLFLPQPAPRVLLVMNGVSVAVEKGYDRAGRRSLTRRIEADANEFLNDVNSSNVSLAHTKIGNREAYAMAGCEINNRGWKITGSTPHDRGNSPSVVRAREEVESLITEFVDERPSSQIFNLL
jgi:hypothetical protein